MSQTCLKAAFQAARPLRRCQEPSHFFRLTRPSNLSTRPAFREPQPSTHYVRLFSHSTTRRATAILHNARVDDDGNEMTIEISERAAKRLKQITSAPPKRNTLVTSSPSSSPDSHLRVTVTSGGCHGFQYFMSLEPAEKIDQEEDTIFSASLDGVPDAAGRAEVVMDLPSLELLKGSTVDFTTELIGSQFKIVGNPRATSSCGCGTSFDVQ